MAATLLRYLIFHVHSRRARLLHVTNGLGYVERTPPAGIDIYQ